jgi:hypothetical protein
MRKRMDYRETFLWGVIGLIGTPLSLVPPASAEPRDGPTWVIAPASAPEPAAPAWPGPPHGRASPKGSSTCRHSGGSLVTALPGGALRSQPSWALAVPGSCMWLATVPVDGSFSVFTRRHHAIRRDFEKPMHTNADADYSGPPA